MVFKRGGVEGGNSLLFAVGRSVEYSLFPSACFLRCGLGNILSVYCTPLLSLGHYVL